MDIRNSLIQANIPLPHELFFWRYPADLCACCFASPYARSCLYNSLLLNLCVRTYIVRVAVHISARVKEYNLLMSMFYRARDI